MNREDDAETDFGIDGFVVFFCRPELPFFRGFDRQRIELLIAAGADEPRVDLSLGRDEEVDHGARAQILVSQVIRDHGRRSIDGQRSVSGRKGPVSRGRLVFFFGRRNFFSLFPPSGTLLRTASCGAGAIGLAS